MSSLPGFTAERSLARSIRSYTSRPMSGQRDGIRPADDNSDPPGVHCYYDSPFCVGHDWLVKRMRWSGGLPVWFQKQIGSCEDGGSTSGGGVSGGSLSRGGRGWPQGPGGPGRRTGGITIDGSACDPDSGDPDCLAVVVTAR